MAAYAAPPKWTVMVYMDGDNNLESYVTPDIEQELAVPGSSADVNVIALADRTPGYDTSRGNWTTTKLFYITNGILADAAHAMADWGERNMADPQTLIDFVAWCKTNYPAEHYALSFWDHGWSWHPGWNMADDTSGDTLEYHEVKNALASLGFIDVIMYDACDMASIEMADLWHGYATAVCGSQEEVGGNGIEYDYVLSRLVADPTMTADQVAVAVAQSAIIREARQPFPPLPLTAGLIRCSRRWMNSRQGCSTACRKIAWRMARPLRQPVRFMTRRTIKTCMTVRTRSLARSVTRPSKPVLKR